MKIDILEDKDGRSVQTLIEKLKRCHSGKMFVEELHDGKSVYNRVCELWISRDSISCINMDVALLHHRLLSPCNKNAAMRQRQQQSLES